MTIENKLIGGFIVLAVMLTGAVIWLKQDQVNAQIDFNDQVSTKVEETNFDWGEIGIKNGIVSADFKITNTGQDNLKLYDVTTSCSCTTAQIFVAESISPIYTMHSNSNYISIVKPGETAKLVVEFDPNFHGPNGVGPINRQITLQTNDPLNSRLSFSVTANVIK